MDAGPTGDAYVVPGTGLRDPPIASRHCERHAEHTPMIMAPTAAQLLPGSNANAAMIAMVAAGKHVDRTPLYRMAHVLARVDIEIGRGTLANWINPPAELHHSRLYEALRRTLRIWAED